MTSNLDAMELQENPIRAGWRLMRTSKIMRDLLNYLTDVVRLRAAMVLGRQSPRAQIALNWWRTVYSVE